MTQVLRRWAGPLLVAATIVAGATGAAQAPKKPRPATTAAKARSFVNRVWVVVASSGVAPGTLYVFLSDGALVISSKGNPSGVGRWRGAAAGLVLTEEGRDYKADVVELTVDRFRLRVHNPGEPTDITLAPAAQRAEGPGDPGPGTISRCPPPIVAATTPSRSRSKTAWRTSRPPTARRSHSRACDRLTRQRRVARTRMAG